MPRHAHPGLAALVAAPPLGLRRMAPWAAAALLAAAGPAAATLSQTVDADGVFGANSATTHFHNAGDGSFFEYVVCIGPDSPMQPCVATLPPFPVQPWHQMAALPSSASAQAATPAHGVNRVRTWTKGTQAYQGHTELAHYSAKANSSWRDEISTTSAVPVVIHFVVALEVDWNDGGLWAFQMGRPGAWDGDLGYAPMEGHTWANCLVNSGNECRFEYFTGDDALTMLPGGATGSVNMLVTQSFTVYPTGWGDPEDPPIVNAFEAMLGARSFADGAEVLSFSSASLQAILVPANAGLSFASGHAYNVQVVPEPATWALWACGLAGLAAWAGRRARHAGSGRPSPR